jgi:hypothetical protein
VKVTDPTLPLQVTVPLAAPEPVTGVVTIPAPLAESVRFPVVDVIPVPAVTVVVAETEVPAPTVVVAAMLPGAMKVEGIDNTTAPLVGDAVISLAVPVTERTSPLELPICIQLEDNDPPDEDWDSKYHRECPT